LLSDSFLARFTSALPNSGRKLAGKAQARVYKLSGGRLGNKFGRAPVLLLTTVGRKSGQSRTTSVMYTRDGDRLVVIGSNAGSERPPAWSLNLLAKPEADVQIGRKTTKVRASVAEGDEHDRCGAC
jgi:deazaflavin-dependent oxidoreductase (nitroreductase family)